MDAFFRILKKRSVMIIFIALFVFIPSLAFSQPHSGLAVHVPIVTKDPPNLQGYQFMGLYDPARFTWRQFNIYFDGGLTHFWVTSHTHHKNLFILSAAPVIRYLFKQRGCLTPYLDLSVGLSYLNQTRFEKRNLGMHFSFQDRLGVGVLFGRERAFALGLTAIHYSNANLAAHNSGVSVPLMLDLAWNF